MQTLATLVKYDGTSLYYRVDAPPDYLVAKQHFNEATIILQDGRSITAAQRRKVFAILNDISKWNYDDVDTNHWHLKWQHIAEKGGDFFSLANCTVTQARLYISFLLDFCLANDIKMSEPILNRTDDINAALYSALMRKKCIVCGKYGELHHAEDRVGAGRNRNVIVHMGMRVMCLCREHHNEAHNIGQASFNYKYHIYGIAADENICEVYKLNFN